MSITSQLVEHCTLLDRPVGLRSSKARLIISTITRRSTSRSSLGSIISKPLGCLTLVLVIIFLLFRLTLAHIESSKQGNKLPQSTHTIHDKTHLTDMPIITWKYFEWSNDLPRRLSSWLRKVWDVPSNCNGHTLECVSRSLIWGQPQFALHSSSHAACWLIEICTSCRERDSVYLEVYLGSSATVRILGLPIEWSRFLSYFNNFVYLV